MKVVLMQDVKGTGKKGETCNVSDGYARNYLLPKNLAKELNAAAINELKGKESSLAHKIETETAKAQADKAALDNKEIVITAKAGTSGRLFGAVTAKEVAAEIEKQLGVSIDRRKMNVPDIKQFGVYNAEIKLYNKITANVKVFVKE